MPLFSVIIPAYNAAATLPETLAALARQTCGDYEAIVLDDGSRDTTAAIADAAAAEDRRIRVIRLANGGPSRARNIGAISEARGRYVAFLDADDIWSEDKLASSAALLLARPDVDGAYGRIAFFCHTPSDARTLSTVRGGVLGVTDVIGENPVCTMSNLVVRRSVFVRSGGFDTGLRHSEDLEFLVRLIASGARIAGIGQTLVYYRASMGGLSSDLQAMHAGWRRVAELAAGVVAPAERPHVRSAEAVHLRYLARRALRIDVPRSTALRFVLDAIRISPAAFFNPLRRGLPTLLAALAEPLLPESCRRCLARR